VGSRLVDAADVTARMKRREDPTSPLSRLSIVVGAIMMIGIAAVVSIALLHRYGGTDPDTELNALRTGGTLMVGIGGAIALLLAARRQRSTEVSLVHTERDATERRITELYTKAADQLGSDQAPVRLAGLYALERLAHGTIEHRQTIVDVICAYLRMPYIAAPETPQPAEPHRPSGRRPHCLLPEKGHPLHVGTRHGDLYQQPRQERQVRLTAQDILARNLRLAEAPKRRLWNRRQIARREPAWPGMQINLAGALLLDFTLRSCRLGRTDFGGAQFMGTADFQDVEFTVPADFTDAVFKGVERSKFAPSGLFGGALFSDTATFRGAVFTTGHAAFEGARFSSAVDFASARFTGSVSFRATHFTGRHVNFEEVRFTDHAYFGEVQFPGVTVFIRAHFTGRASFEGSTFGDQVHFAGAQYRGPFDGAVWPPGWKARPSQVESSEDATVRYLVRINSSDGDGQRAERSAR